MKKIKKIKKTTVCDKCTYLVVVEHSSPMCIRKASFIDSPLLRAVNIKGVQLISFVNAKGNCKYKKRFNLRAFKIRRWMKKDLKRRGLKYFGKNLKYKYLALEEVSNKPEKVSNV